MKPNCKFLLSALLLLCVSLFTGCEYRDIVTADRYTDLIEDDNSCLYILDIDWSEMDELPTGMTVLFYPSDGRFPYIRLSNEVEHYEVVLPQDDYRVLVFNQSVNEFSHLTFSGINAFEKAQVEVISDYDNSQNRIDRLYELPSNISSNSRWVNSSEDTRAKVTQQGRLAVKGLGTAVGRTAASNATSQQPSTRAKVSQQGRLAVKPRINSMSINVRVLGLTNNPMAEGMAIVSAVNGALTGLATGTYLTSEAYTEGSLTHELDDWAIHPANSTDGIGYINTQFGVFGISPDVTDSSSAAPSRAITMMNAETYIESSEEDDNQNILYLNFRLLNGTYVPFRFNVTNRIREQLARGIIELTLDIGISLDGSELDNPLELPEVGIPYGGMQIEVSEWSESTDQTIKLN